MVAIDKTSVVWLSAGLANLGGLIGFISGVSSAAVTLPLLAALFALISGGIAPFVGASERRFEGSVLGKGLLCFCLACGCFLVLGIYVREHGWLAAPRGAATPVAVLKSTEVDVRSLCVNEQYQVLREMIDKRP